MFTVTPSGREYAILCTFPHFGHDSISRSLGLPCELGTVKGVSLGCEEHSYPSASSHQGHLHVGDTCMDPCMWGTKSTHLKMMLKGSALFLGFSRVHPGFKGLADPIIVSIDFPTRACVP
jgi:hypothetical protein